MIQDTALCLICGEGHPNAAGDAMSCPTMLATQATDSRTKNVPPRVYSGYLDAREALRVNAPQAAVRGLRSILSSMAEEQGAQPGQSFSEKIDRLCVKGVIGARMQNTLLKQALSEKMEEAQAWALMSVAEHVFYRLYLGQRRDT